MSSISGRYFIKSVSGSERNYSFSSAMAIFKQLGLCNLFNSVHVHSYVQVLGTCEMCLFLGLPKYLEHPKLLYSDWLTL